MIQTGQNVFKREQQHIITMNSQVKHDLYIFWQVATVLKSLNAIV